MDLLIFTDGSANEEYSEVGATFVTRKIKDDQLRTIKIRRLQQEMYVALFKQKCSTRIRSRMNITTRDLWKTVKIITVIKLSSFKFVQNRTIDRKCQPRSLFKDFLEKLTEQKEKLY